MISGRPQPTDDLPQRGHDVPVCDGGSSPLELPSDFIPSCGRHHFRRQLHSELSEKLTIAIIGLGANATLIIPAAMMVLLHKLSGRNDIVIASNSTGKSRLSSVHPSADALVSCSFWINFKDDPLGCDLARILTRLPDSQSPSDNANEQNAAEKLAVTSAPVCVNFLTCSGRQKEYQGDANYKRIDSGTEFSLNIVVARKRVRLIMRYNAARYSRARVLTILDQYEALVQQIIEFPNRKISSYSLLTPSIRNRLPDPAAELSATWHGAVHRRFSQMARSRPDQVAVAEGENTVTYQELEQRSNQLARYLISKGVGRGDVVAILSSRSASLVWAWLGVLNVGATAVSLDPAHPRDRLEKILQSSRPKALVKVDGGKEATAAWREIGRGTAVSLALPAMRTGNPVEEFSGAPVDIEVGPDDIAYIAFTSGSTGEPKGVLGRHGPLSHFMPWIVSAYELGPADRFSLLAGLSFDPLLREIFTPFWVGGSVCVPDPALIGQRGYLAKWMDAENVTFAHLTPPMRRILTSTAPDEYSLAALRHAFLAGDQLTRRDVESLKKLAPNVTCTNIYGSTEAQRAVGYFRVPSTTRVPRGARSKDACPIGRGMPGSQLLILNGRQLSSVGELGEIHVRSPHLSMGYLDNEGLTAQKFIYNPLTGVRGDRLYATGDFGRYLPNGDVEFVGRTDRQFKISGYRIEPTEIEAVLMSADNVQDAIVSFLDFKNDRRLIAYIVPRHGSVINTTELRRYLLSRLPAAMVPNAIMTIDYPPVTPNGKIDYAKLPRPDAQSHNGMQDIASSDATEMKVVKIWREVLGASDVALNENFFEQGGSSLTAVELVLKMEVAFGREIPLLTIFEGASPKEIANFLRKEDSSTHQWNTGTESLP